MLGLRGSGASPRGRFGVLGAPRRAGSAHRTPGSALDAGRRRLWRLRKRAGQRLSGDRRRHGVFLVGCQRSGTSLLIDTFDRSPTTAVHSEHARAAFQGFRLRDAETVRALIERGPAPVTVFKPICDSQLIDRILDEQPGSQAIWVYRRPADVARSAVSKWGAHQLEVVTAIAEGRTEGLDWRAERIPPALAARLADLLAVPAEDRELTGAMLFWLLRNSFLFELGLDADPRVQPFAYEPMVERPGETLPKLFEATGCAYRPETFEHVDARSLSLRSAKGVADEVVAACESLLERLDAAQPSSFAPGS